MKSYLIKFELKNKTKLLNFFWKNKNSFDKLFNLHSNYFSEDYLVKNNIFEFEKKILIELFEEIRSVPYEEISPFLTNYLEFEFDINKLKDNGFFLNNLIYYKLTYSFYNFVKEYYSNSDLKKIISFFLTNNIYFKIKTDSLKSNFFKVEKEENSENSFYLEDSLIKEKDILIFKKYFNEILIKLENEEEVLEEIETLLSKLEEKIKYSLVLINSILEKELDLISFIDLFNNYQFVKNGNHLLALVYLKEDIFKDKEYDFLKYKSTNYLEKNFIDWPEEIKNYSYFSLVEYFFNLSIKNFNNSISYYFFYYNFLLNLFLIFGLVISDFGIGLGLFILSKIYFYLNKKIKSNLYYLLEIISFSSMFFGLFWFSDFLGYEIFNQQETHLENSEHNNYSIENIFKNSFIIYFFKFLKIFSLNFNKHNLENYYLGIILTIFFNLLSLFLIGYFSINESIKKIEEKNKEEENYYLKSLKEIKYTIILKFVIRLILFSLSLIYKYLYDFNYVFTIFLTILSYIFIYSFINNKILKIVINLIKLPSLFLEPLLLARVGLFCYIDMNLVGILKKMIPLSFSSFFINIFSFIILFSINVFFSILGIMTLIGLILRAYNYEIQELIYYLGEVYSFDKL